jgi:hypothetical protein
MQKFHLPTVALAVPVVVACVVAACSEQPRQQLAPEELELSEALMFVLENVESNGITKYRFAPWKRVVTGRDIEYVSMGNNSIHSSDEDWNARTRNSKFIRYTEKISPLDKCVFRKGSTMEWSKGDSKEDFTALVEGKWFTDPTRFETFYLMNAYRFDVIWEYPRADVIIEGPGVVCEKDDCSNGWGRYNDPDDVVSSSETPVSVARRQKALELIEKACPGKPY